MLSKVGDDEDSIGATADFKDASQVVGRCQREMSRALMCLGLGTATQSSPSLGRLSDALADTLSTR